MRSTRVGYSGHEEVDRNSTGTRLLNRTWNNFSLLRTCLRQELWRLRIRVEGQQVVECSLASQRVQGLTGVCHGVNFILAVSCFAFYHHQFFLVFLLLHYFVVVVSVLVAIVSSLSISFFRTYFDLLYSSRGSFGNNLSTCSGKVCVHFTLSDPTCGISLDMLLLFVKDNAI